MASSYWRFVVQIRHEGILRAINNISGEKNILTSSCHERFQSNLATLPYIFYLYQHASFNKWKTEYAKLPNNYVMLNGNPDQIKADIKLDIILSQNKYGNFQVLAPIADQLNLPLISLEHTLPMPDWNSKHLKNLMALDGNVNIFISEYSCKQWGYDPSSQNVEILHHGIDTNVFKPLENGHGDGKVLSIVNDWKNRDLPCNFQGYLRITKDLPINPVGNTPGFSEPAKDIDDLVSKYQNASVFVNTSRISPVPTAALEAAACECAIVTTATCMLPEIFQNGENAWISNDESYLRDRLIWCLKNPNEAKEMGEKARKTILERFSLENHLKNWNRILSKVYGRGRNFRYNRYE